MARDARDARHESHLDAHLNQTKLRILNTSLTKTTTLLDRTVDPKLQRHFIVFQNYLKNATTDFNKRWFCDDLTITVSMDNFELIKTLGVGGFGRVMLASLKKKPATGPEEYFAIKILDKHNIIKLKQIDHCVQELRILDAVRFPYLVHMVYFFKNNCYLFCVMPLVAGGELFGLLGREGRLDEASGKVFAAQVILAFEYFHANGVVFRDLKPENILIDNEGFLKVTDYGFCKKIDDNRTWTLCGTPEYLAPEVILSQGYNFSVDWWTLGILIFEMVAGHPPFYAPDPMKLYAQIVNGKYRMPEKFSRALQNLVRNLLQTDRDKRFGLLKNGVRDIKTHDWFRELDWQMILSKKIRPAHIPHLPASQRQNSNFETYKEEPLRTNAVEEYPKEFRYIKIPGVHMPQNRKLYKK